MSTLVEFSMSPMGKGESVSEYVSHSLEIIEASGLPYRFGPMGTVIEGEWPEVFGVVQKCYERMSRDCGRITCSIHVDWRRDRSGRLDSKIDSVEKRIGHKLKT
jgi:uncharacterized protein (TIGR00106 family)